eukprot:12309_1
MSNSNKRKFVPLNENDKISEPLPKKQKNIQNEITNEFSSLFQSIKSSPNIVPYSFEQEIADFTIEQNINSMLEYEQLLTLFGTILTQNQLLMPEKTDFNGVNDEENKSENEFESESETNGIPNVFSDAQYATGFLQNCSNEKCTNKIVMLCGDWDNNEYDKYYRYGSYCELIWCSECMINTVQCDCGGWLLKDGIITCNVCNAQWKLCAICVGYCDDGYMKCCKCNKFACYDCFDACARCEICQKCFDKYEIFRCDECDWTVYEEQLCYSECGIGIEKCGSTGCGEWVCTNCENAKNAKCKKCDRLWKICENHIDLDCCYWCRR